MIVARRVYQYGIAFAALWMLINGLAGLLEVVFESVAEALVPPTISMGSVDLAERVSLYGSLTGIGLLVWVIHWWLASRAVRSDPATERRSAIRKLYLYGMLLVGGMVLLFQVRRLLFDVFGLLFGTVRPADFVTGDVLSPLAMLLASGVFWAYHQRLAADDRRAAPEAGAGATLRRWCVYILAYIGLLMVLFGVAGLLAGLTEALTPPSGLQLETGRWLATNVSGRASGILTGLLVWVLAWRWSTRQFWSAAGPDPERASTLRKVYLYIVLLLVVSWTIWNVGQVLYVLVRSLLIPSQAGELWSTAQRQLGMTAANVVTFGVAWAYHASVVTREAQAAQERQRQATIRWIYGYIVAVVGLVVLAMGLSETLSTLLDLLVRPDIPHSDHWWQERLSLSLTLIVVGLPVWVVPWQRLQREVVASVARRSLARRIYLFVALGVTVLTLLGTGAYTLYQMLRAALGETWTAANTSSLLDAASAAAVAGLLLAYHLRVFQQDAALARQDEAADAAATPADVVASPDGDGMVTLLVVRAATAAEAENLRTRLGAALPAGAAIETVQVPAAEANRLLQPPG